MQTARLSFAIACCLASNVALAAPSATAPSDKPRAVVLSVTFRGDGTVNQTLRDTIDGYLDAALDQIGYVKLDNGGRDAMLDADDGKLRACLSTLACKVALAERLNAGMALEVDVVRAEVPADEPAPTEPTRAEKRHGKKDKAAPSDAAKAKPKEFWQLSVQLYPMDVKTAGAKASSDAPYPSLEEVRTGLFALLGKALADERARGRATVRVSSTPTGAAVLLDEKPIGQTDATDIERVVYAGKHRVRVQLDDKTFQEQDLDVAGGGSVRFAPSFVAPVAAPIVSDCPSGARKALRGLGPILIAAGVGVATFGAYAIAVNGTPINCSDANNSGTCMNVYDSQTEGIASLVVGIAAVATGAALTGVGFKKCPEPKVSFAPTVAPGLAAGALRLSF